MLLLFNESVSTVGRSGNSQASVSSLLSRIRLFRREKPEILSRELKKDFYQREKSGTKYIPVNIKRKFVVRKIKSMNCGAVFS